MENVFKIEGRNPVIEALNSDREIDKLYVLKGDVKGSISKILGLAKAKKIPVSYLDKKKLDEMSETKAHQGVIASVSPVSYAEVDDILALAQKKNEPPFIVILDEIEDPHNLGAIIRTANAAGVHGIIIPKHRSAHINAAVVKVSAGACFHTLVSKVVNINNTIRYLKEKGLWFYGATMHGEKNIFETSFSGGVGLIIGNEGSGISKSVLKECDFTVNIPMFGKTESLNASVSAGILIYSVVKDRLRKD